MGSPLSRVSRSARRSSLLQDQARWKSGSWILPSPISSISSFRGFRWHLPMEDVASVA